MIFDWIQHYVEEGRPATIMQSPGVSFSRGGLSRVHASPLFNQGTQLALPLHKYTCKITLRDSRFALVLDTAQTWDLNS